MTRRLLPYGDRAWLLEDLEDPVATAQTLRSWPWPADSGPETVVGARTCLLRFHGTPPSAAQVAAAADAPTVARTAAEDHSITLPVRYDGEDLADVAREAECSVAAVVAMHCGAVFRVAFLGFAPGFAYLEGLPEALRLPRRSVPRVHVPAGSVAIADRYSAVYPRDSPGGWHLLGRTEVLLFDAARAEPSTLRPGMTVRFEAVR